MQIPRAMRYFTITLLVLVLAFSATVNGPAFSQRHAQGCDKADSTAAALDCVNRQNQLTQEKLSQTFKATVEGQSEEARAMLNEAQKDWIIYRDAQCKWEAGLSEAPALARVAELSCLNALTEGRIAILESVRNRAEDKSPREFSDQPRWMNVLAGDYPDIFWRYGAWQSADLDCDEEDEQIMTGIAVARVQDSVEIGDGQAKEEGHHEVEMVIAVSENPLTGRPKSKLLRIPVSESKTDAPHLCRPSVRLEVVDRPSGAEGGTTGACSRMLQIADPVCPSLNIYWNGKTYVLEAGKAGGEAL